MVFDYPIASIVTETKLE